MSFLEEERCLKALEEWLNSDHGTGRIRELLEEDSLVIAKQAFIEGFNAGMKRLNEQNWESWNQK